MNRLSHPNILRSDPPPSLPPSPPHPQYTDLFASRTLSSRVESRVAERSSPSRVAGRDVKSSLWLYVQWTFLNAQDTVELH